jgi:ATP-dependent helicase IRC3
MLARPTKSGVLLQQMIGRGLRRYKDVAGNDLKKNCLVIDFVDTFADGGLHATVPTLLGLRSDFEFRDGTFLPVFSVVCRLTTILRS